jgi:hypothetical protein
MNAGTSLHDELCADALAWALAQPRFRSLEYAPEHGWTCTLAARHNEHIMSLSGRGETPGAACLAVSARYDDKAWP